MIYKLLLFTLLIFCLPTKPKPIHQISRSAFVGKWQLYENYYDPGDGSGKWKNVESKNLFITFYKSGKIISDHNVDFLDSSTNYKLITKKRRYDYMEIKYQSLSKETFFCSFKGDILELIPAEPIWCIEGCGVRLKKTKG